MYINYEVYRKVKIEYKTAEKSPMIKHNLCFSCAVHAANRKELVKSTIVEDEPICDDCRD